MTGIFDFSDAPLEYVRTTVKPWIVANHLDPSRIPYTGVIMVSKGWISLFQFTEPRRVVERGAYALEHVEVPMRLAPPPEFTPYLRQGARYP